jgi:hypothetical protein
VFVPVISHSEARMIAADWHGGQWSALYALSSSGAVSGGAAREAAGVLHLVACNLEDYTWEDEESLTGLCDFLDHAENTWCAENPDAEDFPEYLYGPGEWED